MKLKTKKPKQLLSDKIANALTVKPRADIEDDHVFGTKPKILTRNDLSSSDEDETAISEFRKTNVNLLSDISSKYQGEVTSWKGKNNDSELDSENETNDHQDSESEIETNRIESKYHDSESENETNENQGLESDASASKVSEEDTSDEGESDDYSITRGTTQSDSDGEGSEEGVDISLMEEAEQEGFEHMKEKNVSEEAKKGACVRNQLLIWEGLLEMRIHLQKCVNTANQMPFSEHYEMLAKCGKEEFSNESNKAKINLNKALDKLVTLQSLLLKKFPETKNISTSTLQKEQKAAPAESDEEIPSDTDNEEIPSDTEESENEQPNKTPEKPTKKRKLTDYEKEISNAHKSFKPFRDSTIQKWNEKTRITSGKNVPTNTILQQISYILSDREKLIRKTQLKRSDYDIIGYQKDQTSNTEVTDRKTQDEYIPEIFDDSDFYHQLLRELIECKSADISDPVQLSRQWIALQQMRSKMKRKVDTKATKGRKIKYVVHNQLVNFMGQEKSLTWTDESANELFSSLFGKLFEQNQVGVNVNVDGLKIN